MEQVQASAPVQDVSSVQAQVNPPATPNPPAPVDSESYDSLFQLEQEKASEPTPEPEKPLDPIDPTSYELPWQAGEYEVADQFRSFAAENRLEPETVKKLADWYSGLEKKAVEAEAANKANKEAERLTEFKKSFPNYKEVASEASKAAQVLGGEGLFKALKEAGLLTHPDVVKGLLNVKKFRADPNLAKDSAPKAVVEDRGARLAALRQNPAYHNPAHPDFRRLNDEAAAILMGSK